MTNCRLSTRSIDRNIEDQQVRARVRDDLPAVELAVDLRRIAVVVPDRRGEGCLLELFSAGGQHLRDRHEAGVGDGDEVGAKLEQAAIADRPPKVIDAFQRQRRRVRRVDHRIDGKLAL